MPESHHSSKLASRSSSSSTVVWCAKGTSTYINLRITNTFAGEDIRCLLNDSIPSIKKEIATRGDVALPNRAWNFYNMTSGRVLWVDNASGHQITFGVLGEAVKALLNYITVETAGSAAFTIFDGANMVGTGNVG